MNLFRTSHASANGVRSSRVFGLCAISLALSSAASAQTRPKSATTKYVSTVMGAPRHFDGGHGSDLGFTTSYGSYGIVAFGDTYATSEGAYDVDHNDVWGYFDLASSHRDTPIKLSFWPDNHIIRVKRVQSWSPWSTSDQTMGGGRTPAAITSFQEGSGWHGLFIRGGTYQYCSSDAQCGNFVCDLGLGTRTDLTALITFPLELLGQKPEKLPPQACVLGTPDCVPIARTRDNRPRGLCTDPTSSVRTFTDRAQGRLLSAATVHEFGKTAPGWGLDTYETVPWVTNKFSVVTMRASRSYSDYRRPVVPDSRSGSAPGSASNLLWVWGRPSYWSRSDQNARSEMYLAAQVRAYLPDQQHDRQLALRYYTGGSDNWTNDESKAKPVRTATGCGWEDGVLGHISMVYLDGAQKWLMLYGGGITEVWSSLFGGPIAQPPPGRDNTGGSIKARTAKDPWGPWSCPIDVLRVSDDEICDQMVAPPSPLLPDLPDALVSDRCVPAGSIQSSHFGPQRGTGALYAPAVVEAFTRSDKNSVDIGWFVSTWNSYQVHQMSTHLTF